MFELIDDDTPQPTPAPPGTTAPGLTDTRLAEIWRYHDLVRALATKTGWEMIIGDQYLGNLLAEVDRLRRLEAAGAGLAEIIRGRWFFSIEATEKLAAALAVWDAAIIAREAATIPATRSDAPGGPPP
jgi:hypothetical protein